MGSGWGLAVSSLSSRQAVMGGWRATDETLVPEKDVNESQRVLTWVFRIGSGSQEGRSSSIQRGLGSEPVAKPQLISSPCSQGLSTPPWKLSGQWSPIRET